jgi:hypothetical protein
MGAFEAVLDQYEQLQADIEDQSVDLSTELHEQLAEFEGRLETQLDQHRSMLTELESRFEALRSAADGTTIEITSGEDASED